MPVNFADAAATISQYRKLLDGAAGSNGTDKLIGTNDLKAVMNDPNCPPELKEAANFFLTNPAQLNALETAQFGGQADTATGFGDLDAFTKSFPVQQFGSTATTPHAPQAPEQQQQAGIDPFLAMALLGGTGGGGDSHGLGELATLDPQQLQKLFASSGAGGNYGQLPSEAFLKPAAPTTPPLPGAGPADGFQAAAILHQSYDAIEAVGMTAQGTGAGDANIGLSELKRIADVNSGFPPDVRAAAQFMVDHPTSLRASDGPTTGDPNEVHLSKDDLAKLAANAKGHGALTAPPPGVVVAGGNTQDPRGAPSSAQPKLTPDTVVDEKPMDQRRAVETALKNFDTWGQAGGIGERDAFINLQDIEAVSRSPDAPKDQKAAADFLLKNPAFRNPVDTADQGGAVNGEISKRDLQVFLDRNP